MLLVFVIHGQFKRKFRKVSTSYRYVTVTYSRTFVHGLVMLITLSIEKMVSVQKEISMDTFNVISVCQPWTAFEKKTHKENCGH